jgi:hypothetical protein
MKKHGLVHHFTLTLLMMWLLASLGQEVYAQNKNDTLPDRRVYVPIEQLDVIAGRDRRGVMLSRKDFDALLVKANAAAKSDAAKPAGLIVTSTNYDAKIVGDHLVLDATIKFTQFDDGWHHLNLPFGNVSVEKATIANQAARIGRITTPARGKQAAISSIALIHDSAGDVTLKLKLSTLLESVGNNRAARLSLMPSPSGSLNVQVAAGRHLQLGSRALERPAASDQAAIYNVPVGGQRELLLMFNTQQDEQTADTLTFASTGYGLRVAPGEVTWQAATTLQVYGTTLNQLLCEVPNSLEITDVESTGLEVWDLADSPDDADTTLITLNYRQPFNGTRKIVFKGVLSGAEQTWTVPNLSIRKVTSHTGRVVVQHPPGVRVRRVASDGVRARPGQAGAQSFDLWREDFSLSFETRTKERDVHATVATIADLNQTGVKFFGDIDVQNFFAPLFEVSFRLPAVWVVDSVKLNGKDHRWQVSPFEDDDTWNNYRLELKTPLPAGTQIKLSFDSHQELEQWPIEDEPLVLNLPSVQIPGASIVVGTFAVKADTDLALLTEDLDGIDPTVTGIAGERLGFSFENAEYSGTLTISRKPSRLTVGTATFARLDRETFHSHLEAALKIEGGGLRTLKVLVSETAGQDLRFVLNGAVARIVEQQAGPVANGLRTWTLQLDRLLRGTANLSVDVVAQRGAAEEFIVHQFSIEGADRSDGFIAIEGAADQQIDIKAIDGQSQSLASIDPIDLPASNYRTQQRIVGAYRYTVPGYSVTLKEKRFERVGVPTAICHESNVQTVVGSTGELHHRAEYNLVAIGAQSLRVELPPQDKKAAELWATLIDGQPIEVRSTGNSYLVPLPILQAPDANRNLVLYYRTNSAAISEMQQLNQSPPQVSVIHSEGDEQPLAILNQSWRLFYPGGTVLKSSTGDYTASSEFGSSSVLGSLRDRFTNLNRKTLLENLLMPGIVILILAVIAITIRRVGFGWVGIAASVITVGVFATWFMGTQLQQVQQAREYAGNDAAAPANATGFNDESDDGDGASIEFRGGTEKTMAPDESPLDVAELSETVADALVSQEINDIKPPMNSPRSEPKSFQGEKKKLDDTKKSPPAAKSEALPGFDFRANAGGVFAQVDAENDKDEERKRDERFEAKSGLPTAGKGFSGLLSLALDLEVPQNSDHQDFRYSGSQTAKSLSLQIDWEDRQASDVKRALVLFVVAFVLILLIRKSSNWRVVATVLCVTVPLGLVSVAPSAWHVALDGVFLGAITAVVLWLCRTVCIGLGRSRFGKKVKSAVAQTATESAKSKASKSVTASLLLIASLAATFESNVLAADPVPQQSAPNVTQPRVVIPYLPGQDPLLADRVLLTRDQFLKLWNQANPNERLQQTAPVDGLVADALFTASLKPNAAGAANNNKGVVAVSATLILHSFVDKQITVPVPIGQIALSSAKLNDKSAPLKLSTAKGQSQLDIVLDGKGTYVLDLEFAVAAQLTGSVGQFTLPVAPVPAGRVVFTLPAKGLSVRVNGSTNAYRRKTTDASESIEIPVGQGKPLTIAWRPPEQKGMVNSIVNVATNVSVWVGNEGLSQKAQIDIKVPQGSVADLSFAVPDAIRIREISGPHMAGWQAVMVNDKRQLKVFFNPPITEATTLNLDLFSEQDFGKEDTKFAIPTIAPLEVTREIGVIGVVSTDDFGVRNGDIDNVTRLDVSNQVAKSLPAHSTQAKLAARLAWRFVSRPFSLQCVATRRMPASNAVVSHATQVARRRVHIGTHMRATLEGSPRSVISFRLPESYLLVNVNATEMKDWFVTAADDSNPRTLTIELKRPMMGKIETVLQGYAVKGADDFLLELRFPEPLEISSMKSAASVAFDESYKASVTNVGDWKEVDSSELPTGLRNKQSAPIQFSFTSESVDEKMIEFEIAQIPPELTTNAVVITTVGDTFVEFAFYLDWKIEGAAVDTFTFDAPKSLDGRLKIVVPHPTLSGEYIAAPRVREVQTTDAGADNTRWTVTLKKPLKNRYLALAIATVPVNQSEIQAPSVSFVQPVFDEFGASGEFGPVAQQQLFAILANPSIYQLSPKPNITNEAITAERLPIKLPKEFVDQAVNIFRVQDAAQMPTWTVKKLEQQAGAPASVNVADLTLVLAKDGTWRSQAVYTIRNRRRQFLGLKLPEKARLLSVFVKGQPSRPVLSAIDDQPIHLIALPKSSASDTSFTVQVVCTGSLKDKLPAGFSFDAQEIDLPAPHVVTQKESAEYGIPVARTLWTVYVPKSIDAALIDDSAKSNLRRVDDSKTEIQDAYAIALLQDLSSGNTVMENEEASGLQQEFAASNFEDVNESLSLYAESTKDEKTRAIIVQEQQKFFRNQKRVQESARNNDANTNGTKIDRQRQLIAGNNRSILLDNAGSMDLPDVADTPSNKADSSIQFQLESKQSSRPSSRKPGTPEVSNRNTATRTKKHQQSLSNLDDLNSRISNSEMFSDKILDNTTANTNPSSGEGNEDKGGQAPGGAKSPPGRKPMNRAGRRNGARDPFSPPVTVARNGSLIDVAEQRGVILINELEGIPRANEGQLGGNWSQVGGLSLAVDIPKDGTELKFTKVSGQPKLALQFRSRELLDTGLGIVWTIVWVGIGVVLLIAFGRVGQTDSATNAIAISLFAAGLASYLILPSPLNTLGFVAFVVGAVTLAIRYAKARSAQ